jgi:hypothetical protein
MKKINEAYKEEEDSLLSSQIACDGKCDENNGGPCFKGIMHQDP